jgi:hypothetical protein
MLFITVVGLVLGVSADRRARPSRALRQVDDLRGSIRGRLLELDLCNLRGNQMELLPYLRDVKTVSLGNARMDRASAHAIGRMTTLTKLTMPHAEIDDEGLDELAGLRELTELRLDYTHCTLAGVARLNVLPKLQELSMQGLQGEDLQLVDFSQLLTASFTNPELKRIHIERMPSLRRINVTGGACEVTLATLPQLTSLHIKAAALRDAYLDDLPALQNVELEVREPQATDDRRQLCVQLSGLPSLARVELVGLGLTDDDCAAIAASPTLAAVIIGDARAPLTIEGVRHLVESKALQTLDLTAAAITDEARAFVEQSASNTLIQVNLPDETMIALLREGYSLTMIRRMSRADRATTVDGLKRLRAPAAIKTAL